MRLPKRSKKSPLVFDGPSIHVIGDIHGCLKQVQQLMAKIDLQQDDELVFIGDYIDRGPQSREVVDYLLGLPFRCVFLLGNHEKMLLDYLAGKDEGLFLPNGGMATLRSYGGGVSGIPPAHLSFFRNLQPFYETPEYFFVHAGIRPMVSLDKQELDDLLWIRQEFFQFIGRFPKPVVFGHTPLRSVLLLPDRIGIDTGCVYGGKLTCLKLPQREIIHVAGWRG